MKTFTPDYMPFQIHGDWFEQPDLSNDNDFMMLAYVFGTLITHLYFR